jgi:hypothetical protein
LEQVTFHFQQTTIKHSLYCISFVSFQPYFGQNPRSTETWNITTVRAGVALKFGQGKKHQQATDMLKDARSTVFYQFP